MRKTHLICLFIFLMGSISAFSQKNINGVVTDPNGEPLIGVNVLVKGTTVGTITDYNGKYSIEARNGAVLSFTYIGYVTQQVKVANQKTINVILKEDSKTLDEVVVVGYGKMTRKDVTSSITTVQSKDLNVGVYSSPAQMLQGKVPGLTITTSSNPNAGQSITLRGASTLRTGAAQEPYYVVDGVPGVSLSLISPDDIESIDVLRDASATAIYGSKAANGVIIVTTKKGKSGDAVVNYSGYIAVDNITKNWDVMDANQIRDYAKANNVTLNDYGANTDWQKEVQRTAISHNHNISISGGTDRTQYNASFNYLDNQGTIKGTDMDRMIGRSFIQTKALKNLLTLSFNLNASITNSNNVPSGKQGASVYDAMCYYSPLAPVKNEDGTWFEDASISQYYNPVSLIKENIYKNTNKRIQGAAKATLDITKWLTYNISLSYQNEQNIRSEYNSSKSLVAMGMNGQAERSTAEYKKKVMETYLNLDKTFNDVHKLGLMAGYSWEESNDNDGFQLRTYNYFNDDLTYHNMGMANNIDINGLGGYNLSTLRMISVFGRMNYAYNSKYLFQATVRRDGSSAFGKNNRWATFPSASVAWRISEEKFIKDLNLFDDLKLRAGYGVSGNSLGFDVFTATQLYGATGWFTNSNGNLVHTLGAIRNSNPDLKWERTSMLNLGLDFGFFNNRLTGTVEYYNKTTKDLIADYSVSTTQYLYGWLTTNVGEISNKGVELTINAIPVQTKDFTWNTTLNLSHNKNCVEKISNAEFSVNYMDKANLDAPGQSNSCQQRIMEGHPIGQFYTWEWAGYNEDGVSIFNEYDKETHELIGTTTTPQDKDRNFTGSAQPKLNLGWNNTFTYKNLTLTAFMQGVFGNKIMNASRAYLSNIANFNTNKNVLASIIKTDKMTDHNSHLLSDRYLEKGDYLRMASISLDYNFGKIGDWVNNFHLYATCNNAFTITDYKGLDPEVNLGGIEPGIDNRQTYPRTRTFMFGAKFNF